MKKILTMILLVLSGVLYAQSEIITGTLYNEKGLPLVGATVLIDGTSSGVISDFDGNFKINVPSPVDKKYLNITTLGYETKIVRIGDKKNLKVTLQPDAEDLDEVVVVGYGTVKKSDLTGAVSTVKAEDIEQSGANSIDVALQGRAAGVAVTQSSGSPGGGAAIRIRGISSLNGSDPLYIIDGVPMENTADSGLGEQDLESATLNPLSMINPADIESVEILKDASSTAIYGSRGANGVVLITTKQGKEGKGVIKVDQEYGISKIPGTIDLLDANEYTILFAEAYKNGGLAYTNTKRLDSARAGALQTSDWQNTIMRMGKTSNTSVSFSGGNKDLRYLVSNNYLNTQGIIDGTDYKRASSRVNLNASLSEKIKVKTSINYAHVDSQSRTVNAGSNTNRGQAGALSRALRSAPTTNLNAENEDEGVDQYTPQTAIDANEYNNLLTQFSGKLDFIYNVNKALSLKTSFSHQNRYTAQRFYQYNILPRNIAEGGRAKTSDSRRTRTTLTNTISYKKKISRAHNIDAVLGQSIEVSEDERLQTSNFGFANDLLTFYDPGSAAFYDPDVITYRADRLSSFFGRVNYNFKRKYYLTLTGRFDGASKFAANNKWAFFPAAALAYNIDKEEFMRSIKAVSGLKLRVSYGLSGNQRLRPYESLNQYGSLQTGFGNGSGGDVLTTGYYATQLPNPDLTWETTSQLDVGVDLRLFKNKISASFEYYSKITDDLLFTGNRIPVQSGQSTFTENYGQLETEGFEASVDAHIINTKQFSWDVRGNISTGKTKIKDLASDYRFSGWDPGFFNSGGGTQRLIIGEEVGAFYGYKTSGIAQFDDFVEFQGLTKQEQVELYNQDLTKGDYTFVDGFDGGVVRNNDVRRPGQQLYEDVADENGVKDGQFSEDDKQVIGTAQPDITLGLNNSFKIGNVDFSFFFDGTFGQDVANLQNAKILVFANRQGLSETMNRWTPENPSTIWPRVDSENRDVSYFSDRFVEDASYLRLRNVSIGYNLGKKALSNLDLSNLRVYILATNLYTWTNYTGYNPDVSIRGSSTGALGHDRASYPLARTITLGVKMKF